MRYDLRKYDHQELAFVLDPTEEPEIYTCNSSLLPTSCSDGHHVKLFDAERRYMGPATEWLKARENRVKAIADCYHGGLDNNGWNPEAEFYLAELVNDYEKALSDGSFDWDLNDVDNCEGSGADKIDLIMGGRRVYSWPACSTPATVHRGEELVIGSVPGEIDAASLKSWLLDNVEILDEISEANENAKAAGNDSELKTHLYAFQAELHDAVVHGPIQCNESEVA